MIRSMTGFGRAEIEIASRSLTIEIRSLNSKLLDISMKIPVLLRRFEPQIRQMAQEHVGRGKVEINAFWGQSYEENLARIDEKRFEYYAHQLRSLANKYAVDGDLLAQVMRMPEVITNEETLLAEDLETPFLNGLMQVFQLLGEHRLQEGRALEVDLLNNLNSIESKLAELTPFEEERKQQLRDRFQRNFEELKVEADPVRFHQELIYYFEKWDINEEKVRLNSHIELFRQEMKQGERQGRKLQFVAQEIGREINTIGSKCQQAEMQKRVVDMKDNLEQIKEQLGNIL